MRTVCARVLTGIAALVVISGVSVSPLEGQRLGPAQKRPKLAAGADTNDALAYLTYAARELGSAPDAAAAAFHWAARLDPSSADALYKAREDKKDEDVIFYDSKALAEHSIGLLWTQKGDLDSATAAFGRATAEDLSYHPAHVALGVTALARHDSVTAVSELSLAAELAVDDSWTQFLHGGTLLVTGQNAAARASYERFIALSSRRNADRAVATERVAALAKRGAP